MSDAKKCLYDFCMLPCTSTVKTETTRKIEVARSSGLRIPLNYQTTM
jgi:hypothetical protein